MWKRFAVGLAWWLAVAYGWEFMAAMYGLPHAVGPILALLVAAMIVGIPQSIAWKLTSRRITRARLVKAGMTGALAGQTRT
jgi:hypothetical protein